MRRFTALGAFAAFSLTAFDASAQVANQFDLVCEGQRQREVDGPREPYSVRFRVDLDQGRFCWRACDRIDRIADVAPDRIWLRRTDPDNRQRDLDDESISRVTGQLDQLVIMIRPYGTSTYVKSVAQCEQAAFSGFPATKF